MKYSKSIKKLNTSNTILLASAALLALLLMLYKLGSLTKGLSYTEVISAKQVVGWHGLYNSPLYLPLKLVRSIVFSLYRVHNQFLTRLPNAVFGLLSMLGFSWLIYLWHGKRTAILASILFITSAWTLHVSRLASFDVMYLFGIIALLLGHGLLYRAKKSHLPLFLNLVIWGLLAYIPGFIWFIVLDIFLQRLRIKASLKTLKSPRSRILAAFISIIWLPLLIIDLTRKGQLKIWLGLPTKMPSMLHFLKEFLAVFVHIFIRGPENPALWLGKTPLLDVFTLFLSLLGLYFYITHYHSSRSQLLGLIALISALLIALGGPVNFSLVVPLAYILTATGLAYFLHMWLKVFPRNPLGRSVGIGLITFAVIVSGLYNTRSYFIAWRYNPTTKSTFSHRL
jgi:hypothetical protein